jgi:aspartate 4-decarboxylase
MINPKMKEFLSMSPFEFKNVLIKTAEDAAGENKQILNAGRGNPNFLNTTVRKAFCCLNMFAAEVADKNLKTADLGLRPQKKGIAKEFKTYLENKKEATEVSFLKKAIDYAENEFSLDPDDFIFELVDASLGDFYPDPPRIFPNTEKVVNKYLTQVLCPESKPASGKFDLFATEGATAAMVYVFNSLKENKILHSGDHIAIITPIFSPYLEIPVLKDYNLVEIDIKCDEGLDWQITDSEIEKLKDKKIKALFLVHPTNPTSVMLNEKTLKKIEDLVEKERDDLIILTDTVYATFVDGFHSIVEVAPKNTICVYSYSKFFGATGWRLGIIMLHEDNVIDKLIAKLGDKDVAQLNTRYKMDSTTPQKIKFIDRLEMDSRDVALAHTGGLSCPQQCMICLFSLFYLLDKDLEYKHSIQKKLKKRVTHLYSNLGIKLIEGPAHTYYYATIDFEIVAKEKYGEKFADYLTKNVLMIEFLLKLAKEKLTICLPGQGFAAPKWSLRVSLANLDDDSYIAIGKNLSDVLEQYYEEWDKKNK